MGSRESGFLVTAYRRITVATSASRLYTIAYRLITVRSPASSLKGTYTLVIDLDCVDIVIVREFSAEFGYCLNSHVPRLLGHDLTYKLEVLFGPVLTALVSILCALLLV